VLAAHVKAGGGRFRGIRQQAQSHHLLGSLAKRPTPDGLLSDPAFRRGLEALGRLGLVFDAVVFFTQLGDLATAARGAPEARIVLNHLGWPMAGPSGDRRETFRLWRAGMKELATCSNVSVKLGGLGMTAFGFGFEHRPVPPGSQELAETWSPFVETAIALFGPDRCMFESNFPVDGQSCGYGSLWNAFKRMTALMPQGERTSLFSDTARRVYGLPEIHAQRA